MTGPRGYDAIALLAEFDIDSHIAVAGRIPLRLRSDSFGRDPNRSSFEKALGNLISRGLDVGKGLSVV